MTTATVDDKRRVRIPNLKPGQVYAVQTSPDGRTVHLTRMEPEPARPAKVRLVKKDGYTVIESDRPFNEAAVKAPLEEFP